MRRNSTFGERFERLAKTITAISIGLLSFNGLFSAAYAAGGLTNASVLLSDPRPDAAAASVTYGVSWKAGTTATLQCITYKVSTSSQSGIGSVPTGFSNSAATNGTFTGLTAANWTIDNSTNGTIKETYATGQSVSSGTQVTTPIVSITNPTNSSGGTWYVELKTFSDSTCSTLVDTSIVGFFTTPSVLVSATIDSTLSFSVTGVAASTTYKGAFATHSSCNDTATGVSFGTPSLPLSADTAYDCAQTLTTSTNGNGGYQVTVQGKQTGGDFLKLVSDATKTITDSSGTNATPAATPGTPAEMFGYTTNDSTLFPVANRFTTSNDLFAAVATTPGEVAYNAGAVAGDAVNVGYRLKFTGTTESGVYRGTLVYTCTPVF